MGLNTVIIFNDFVRIHLLFWCRSSFHIWMNWLYLSSCIWLLILSKSLYARAAHYGLGGQRYSCWLYDQHGRPMLYSLIDQALSIHYRFYGAGDARVTYLVVPTFSRFCRGISCAAGIVRFLSRRPRWGYLIDTEYDLQVLMRTCSSSSIWL